MRFIRRPQINQAKFQAAAALLQRWLGRVLVWLTNLGFRRTPEELKRTEYRLRQLIVISAFMHTPRTNFRAGAHRKANSYSGSLKRFMMRGLLPRLSRFQFNRVARIAHVGRNIARYVRKFLKRLARGLLMIRRVQTTIAPMALISTAPAPVCACADTS
jgi:hypothetical protein